MGNGRYAAEKGIIVILDPNRNMASACASASVLHCVQWRLNREECLSLNGSKMVKVLRRGSLSSKDSCKIFWMGRKEVLQDVQITCPPADRERTGGVASL